MRIDIFAILTEPGTLPAQNPVDGATHIAFEPLDFIARLSTLAPKPGVNLSRYHDLLSLLCFDLRGCGLMAVIECPPSVPE